LAERSPVVLEELPAPVLARHYGCIVVRDDKLPGGTKRRVLREMMASDPHVEFVFGGPAQGYAQLALAYAARDCGKSATYFVAERRELHPLTREAQEAGAKIVQVPAGRLSVVQARARTYAGDVGALFYPLGFDVPEFHQGLVALAKSLPIRPPREVWATAGSGALSRALQSAWPDAQHHAVRIGFQPDIGRARLYVAPEAFGDTAAEPPSFPSCPWYDAKMWVYVRKFASAGALAWNVGA